MFILQDEFSQMTVLFEFSETLFHLNFTIEFSLQLIFFLLSCDISRDPKGSLKFKLAIMDLQRRKLSTYLLDQTKQNKHNLYLFEIKLLRATTSWKRKMFDSTDFKMQF